MLKVRIILITIGIFTLLFLILFLKNKLSKLLSNKALNIKPKERKDRGDYKGAMNETVKPISNDEPLSDGGNQSDPSTW